MYATSSKKETRGKEIRKKTKDEAKQYGGLRRRHDGPMILQVKDFELKNSVFMIEREGGKRYVLLSF